MDVVRPYLIWGAAVLLLLLAFPAASWAGDGGVIDASPLVDYVVGLVTAVLGTGAAAVTGWLSRLLRLKADDATRRYLDEIAARGIDLVRNRLMELGHDLSSIEVRQRWVADAGSYLARSAPDALKRFGLTEERVSDYVRARLPAPDGPARPVGVQPPDPA